MPGPATNDVARNDLARNEIARNMEITGKDEA
jgi:hypothetical protein